MARNWRQQAAKDAEERRAAEEQARVDQIRADARSGTNWASELDYGPACVCGAFPAGSTVTHAGTTTLKGICHRHGTYQPSRIAREG